MSNDKSKNLGGRPTVMTPDVIRVLEEAFGYGATDEQACFQAGIHKDTLYEYQKRHPQYADRKQALKDQPLYKAKRNMVKIMDKLDEKGEISREAGDMSKFYAERKGKAEFSTRSEQTGADGKDLPPAQIVIQPVKVKDDE